MENMRLNRRELITLTLLAILLTVITCCTFNSIHGRQLYISMYALSTWFGALCNHSLIFLDFDMVVLREVVIFSVEGVLSWPENW